MKRTVEELARYLGGRLSGSSDVIVDNLAELDAAAGGRRGYSQDHRRGRSQDRFCPGRELAVSEEAAAGRSPSHGRRRALGSLGRRRLRRAARGP